MSLLLSCQNLSKTFGARSLFEGVNLSIEEGERIGLIGPNGSGKSTLLKILAGLEIPDLASGGDDAAITSRRNLRAGYVAQKDRFNEGDTALATVMAGLTDSFHDEHDRLDRAMAALSRIGFDDMEQPVAAMSGGWRKRLAIARELAREPDLLLMDEPTNHLDVAGIEWLEELLEAQPFATVIVTHDRYFLENAVTRVMELSRAYPGGIFTVDGCYSEFLERRAEFLDAQAAQQQALASKVREDIRWLSRGAKARRTKSKSRIDASHQRMDELADLAARNAPARAAAVDFSATGRQTRKLIAASGVRKTMGQRLLFDKLELELAPGTRIGLLGSNGTGKTTLIRLLTGDLAPDAGTVKRADNLRTVVFTQNRDELDPRSSLREALAPGSDFVIFRDRQLHVHTWASRFLFRPDQFNTSVGDLSGGEQARVLIARLMLKSADVLILDEPTNDLDIASLEVLEQSLLEFPGAVVLVTHDRYMLDRISTEILALDGSGTAKRYADLNQWRDAQERIEQEKRAAAAAANRPTAPATAQNAAKDSATASTGGGTTGKVKLSFKEKRELDQMEANIHQAEAKVKELEATVSDPKVIADHKRMQAACRELDAAHALVSQLYARWEELEAKQG
jgi:ATP-binding cassette subfamily F protein uup